MLQHNSPEPGSRWDALTKTGAGTPMGDLLRRYWWPIAGASELEKPGTLAVRLMGEDLVLYKDLGGKYGLIDRHCLKLPRFRGVLASLVDYASVGWTSIACS